MFSRYPFHPYCGSPPSLATVWERWNLDPLLVSALIVSLVMWRIGNSPNTSSRAPPPKWRRVCFCAGWILGALALISPLCALSVSLFSARVGQHMILTALVAPLIALGLPAPRIAIARNALFGALAFTVALWFWHAPGPYTATFDGPVVYWLMHITTFGAALWFWRAILHAPSDRMATAIAATLIASVQMAFLGAVITFAPRAIYPPHTLTTLAWGMTPLQDQQLGGVIMWIPAGVIFVCAILMPLGAILGRSERSDLSAATP